MSQLYIFVWLGLRFERERDGTHGGLGPDRKDVRTTDRKTAVEYRSRIFWKDDAAYENVKFISQRVAKIIALYMKQWK